MEICSESRRTKLSIHHAAPTSSSVNPAPSAHRRGRASPSMRLIGEEERGGAPRVPPRDHKTQGISHAAEKPPCLSLAKRLRQSAQSSWLSCMLTSHLVQLFLGKNGLDAPLWKLGIPNLGIFNESGSRQILNHRANAIVAMLSSWTVADAGGTCDRILRHPRLNDGEIRLIECICTEHLF